MYLYKLPKSGHCHGSEESADKVSQLNDQGDLEFRSWSPKCMITYCKCPHNHVSIPVRLKSGNWLKRESAQGFCIELNDPGDLEN